MLVYALICLSLALAGVAGLQFFYLVYLERLSNEHKKCIRTLERHSAVLSARLEEAELSLAEKDQILDAISSENEVEEEMWADVIEEN